MIVVWDLISRKKKFDSKLLKANYIKCISLLKKHNAFLNDWAFENNYLVDKKSDHPENKLTNSIRERNNTFAACYTSGDSAIPLEFVIESIKETIKEPIKEPVPEIEEISTTNDNKIIIKKRSVSEALKKQIAGKQKYKCANKPNSNLKNLEDYICPFWNKQDDSGCFDESGYEIDHIEEHCINGNDSPENLQALCKCCHIVKTKRFLMSCSK